MEAVVQRHDLAHHKIDRSPVDQEVVSAPYDAVFVLAQANDRDPEQWRDGEVEAASTIICQKGR